MNPLVVICAAATLLLVTFVLLLRRMDSRSRLAPVTPAWVNQLSLERYKPMERLLREDDYRFLASQKGFHPTIARKLRAQRLHIFREYLRWLDRDFGQVARAMQMLMMSSPRDRPDLAVFLLKQQFLFRVKFLFLLRLAGVRVRLATHLGRADVRELVHLAETLRVQCRQLSMYPPREVAACSSAASSHL
jgi:hypothetical protein